MKAQFKLAPDPVDGIDFKLTPTERSYAAWIAVKLEANRRERNRWDALTPSKRVSK